MKTPVVDETLLGEIVRRVREVADPQRIILFGSAAAGTMTPDSDIDLLVLEEAPQDRREESYRIRGALCGMGVPFDVIVLPTRTFEAEKNVIGGIAYPAHNRGRVIYEEEGVSMESDDAPGDFVERWLETAQVDIDAAIYLLSSEHPFFGVVGFHSQQAGEKFLKALLTFHQVDFPKTHIIEDLLKLVRTADQSVATMLQDTVPLAKYAVETRYPGDVPTLSRADAEMALIMAQRIREVVLTALGRQPN